MSTPDELVRQLLGSGLDVQIAAAEALTHLAEEAQPAIVALVQNCGSENEGLCNWCTAALEGIGAPSVEQIDELTMLARSANADVAYWAVTLLGRAGELASSAVSTLTERAGDDSVPAVQKRAAWALKKIQAA